MAKLTNTHLLSFNSSNWERNTKRNPSMYRTGRVGNNRTVELHDDLGGNVNGIAGKLHGSTVAYFEPDHENHDTKITLDPCGYETTTTRQAMCDFVEGFTGVRCGVSFAKGKFTARVLGTDYTANDLGLIEITVPGIN